MRISKTILYIFIATVSLQPLASERPGSDIAVITNSNATAIPQSFYSIYDPYTIARAIVQRIGKRIKNFNELDIKDLKVQTFSVNLKQNSEVVIMVPYSALENESLIELGYLNGFQTGHGAKGHVDFNPIFRAAAENNIAGIKIAEEIYSNSWIGHYVRPKYGLLNVLNSELIGKNERGLSSRNYGEVTIVLSESIKDRVTYTLQDSVGLSGSDQEFISKWVRLVDGDKFYLYPYGSYTEAQIWGPITISDIQEFRVMPFISSKKLEMVQSIGLPVFEKKPNGQNGKMLFPGNIKLYKKNLDKMRLALPKEFSSIAHLQAVNQVQNSCEMSLIKAQLPAMTEP